jgi:hypothetical protein
MAAKSSLHLSQAAGNPWRPRLVSSLKALGPLALLFFIPSKVQVVLLCLVLFVLDKASDFMLKSREEFWRVIRRARHIKWGSFEMELQQDSAEEDPNHSAAVAKLPTKIDSPSS